MIHVFCMSSHGVNICVKFHENMSIGLKVMERTQKLLTDTHTKKKTIYPIAYILCMPRVSQELQFMCSACRLKI